ncbi:hypothetical protein MMC29_007704 [Sticta canariensis]|nr:hypothetical protein [Sticta canariensis]
MVTITFSSLPAEIHDGIASYCGTNDLKSLCLTSKWMNEIVFRALYRYVDLQVDSDNVKLRFGIISPRRAQQQFVHTLLSHPEYGKEVRSLKTSGYIPIFQNGRKDMRAEENFWRAMLSLTHVQSVDLNSKPAMSDDGTITATQIDNMPRQLFRSVTSIKLAGMMPYGPARSILSTINPATLKYLFLDRVDGYSTEKDENGREKRREDRTYIYKLVSPGLLTTLTGRCTALQTLILRRVGHFRQIQSFDKAVEEASYTECASFIRSVQAIVKEFTFDHFENEPSDMENKIGDLPFRVMDERFLRLVLPTIVSSNWPCLTMMQLRGIRTLNGQDGKVALTMQLEAILGRDAKIVVEESIEPLNLTPKPI